MHKTKPKVKKAMQKLGSVIATKDKCAAVAHRVRDFVFNGIRDFDFAIEVFQGRRTPARCALSLRSSGACCRSAAAFFPMKFQSL
jgi:hypothetical protein